MIKIEISTTKNELGKKAALNAAQKIEYAIQKKGNANIILATGASQFDTLHHLVENTEIDWSKVVMFHLDEYAGMEENHPASFRRYLRERFVDKVPALEAVYFIDGDREDLTEECRRLNTIINQHPIDVALVGIGENAHLAFNDPPANFEEKEPYIIVDLDEACRRQQMGEGWFASLEDVPKKAISMSVMQIMKSKSIICSVPDQRKAVAVSNCLEKEVSNMYPASILQKHSDCTLYLDTASASLLSSSQK
ncbi:glucosamine-6-phosphate deaminase [Catalinimonas alkaloidigena]|uniref:glucosamine-6-phosphate deaminase n=1 Tax=Catalinimonas alkaloidigena TaxID=1075417 RepID=UPI0030B8F5F5|nr:glucosamine-6-phosphate deaminase [Catalinimonas alkaloidigena]